MIRPYQSGDYEKLILLYKDSSNYGGSFDETRDQASRLEKTSKIGNLLICQIDSSVVGSVMILDNPHSFWLLRFVIDSKNHAAKQAGQELLNAVDEIAKKRGHKSIIVYTGSNNETLKKRYSNLGFNESLDYRCFWKEI